jgi:hypothetical protein
MGCHPTSNNSRSLLRIRVSCFPLSEVGDDAFGDYGLYRREYPVSASTRRICPIEILVLLRIDERLQFK